MNILGNFLLEPFDSSKIEFSALINPTYAESEGYKVAIGFNTNDLYYDVKNTAYLIADVMKVDDENMRHQILDICEEGNKDIVTRVMNLAFYEITDKLSRRVPIETTGGAVFDSVERYGIAMMMKDSFPKQRVWYIRNLIHAYIITRILIEYFMLVGHEMSKIFSVELESIIENFNKAIEDTKKISIRPHRPF